MSTRFDEPVQALLEDLEALASAPPTTKEAQENARTAHMWRERLLKRWSELKDTAPTLSFLGPVGVGKSSLIAVLADLLVGGKPMDRASLKERSMLAVGSGRTTVCEVQIRARREGDGGQIGLVVEPLSRSEVEREIRIFAEDEWARRQRDAKRSAEDDADPTAQEIHRAIRGMTRYEETVRISFEGNLKRRHAVRPLDEVIARFSSAEELAEHLIERADLPARKSGPFWAPDTPEHRRALKERFENVNQGREAGTTLPHVMTVVVPTSLPDSEHAPRATLVDTRGLDGSADARRDLQARLRDPGTVIVLCVEFKGAPGDAARALLRSMLDSAELRPALSRTLLLLVDLGDAEQVNEAEGDRELGQELKIEECHRALETGGLAGAIRRDRILAFDALKDDRLDLVRALDTLLVELRGQREQDLDEQIQDARMFVRGAGDDRLEALRKDVDGQLLDTAARRPLSGAPLSDPLQGAYKAIQSCRYASVVRATCRRNGFYSKLDLYAAIHVEAARAATSWLHPLLGGIKARLDELEADSNYDDVRDHLRSLRRQYEDAGLNIVLAYAESVQAQAQELLEKDPVWAACSAEWAQGGGFKNRVIGHLEAWARGQPGLTAHEHTTARDEIPLLEEVTGPWSPPPQRLEVRHFGPIACADIQFGDLSVLVGPQATGKSIFLQLLKLVCDERNIRQRLRKFGLDWSAGSKGDFLDLYFGQGMRQIWDDAASELKIDGQAKYLPDFALDNSTAEPREDTAERMFFIPAQRVMSLREGQTRPFTDYRAGDPYSLREFSEQIHAFVEGELSSEGPLFPRTNRLDKVYQEAVARNIFGAFGVNTQTHQMQRRIVLADTTDTVLPYLVWSAGQREFVPLLLGLLWLMPPWKASRRDGIEWVVIEEPEMGLHPHAISVFLGLVLNLLARGYRVVLATHSPHVLDVVWGLQFLKAHAGSPNDVVDMLALPNEPKVVADAAEALHKSYRVHYFQRGGDVRDISSLDPGAEDPNEAGWGGLSELSGRVGDVVARVARRHEAQAHE